MTTLILTLGVPGTGPYGQINSLRASIKDSKQHLQNMEAGAERKTKAAIKCYEDSISKDRGQIKKIQAEEKKKKENTKKL